MSCMLPFTYPSLWSIRSGLTLHGCIVLFMPPMRFLDMANLTLSQLSASELVVSIVPERRLLAAVNSRYKDTVVVALPLGALQADVHDTALWDVVVPVRADAAHESPLKVGLGASHVEDLAIPSPAEVEEVEGEGASQQVILKIRRLLSAHQAFILATRSACLSLYLFVLPFEVSLFLHLP